MSVFRENWFWLIVLFVGVICTVPFIVIYLVLLLQTIWWWVPACFMVVLIVVWALVSGYKDWVTARRKEDEEKSRVGTA
jgi:membrane protein required for beta-lactamase induction